MLSMFRSDVTEMLQKIYFCMSCYRKFGFAGNVTGSSTGGVIGGITEDLPLQEMLHVMLQ